MSSIAEIEDAIQKLPATQVEELVGWLEKLRARRVSPLAVESWLQRARGVVRTGVTTAGVLSLTRGEE